MRKLCFLITCSAALVGLLGMSAPALANHVPGEDHDPKCQEGSSGYKPLGIYEQDIKLTPQFTGVPAKTRGQGYACSGRGYRRGGSTDMWFKELSIFQPAGIYIRNTRRLGSRVQGRYAGSACVGVLSDVLGYQGRSGELGQGSCPLLTQVDIRVDNSDSAFGTDKCSDEAIACFKGQGLAGHGWISVIGDPQYQGYILTIHKFNAALGRASLTRIESLNASPQQFNPPFQCDRLGSRTGTTCGGANDPVLVTAGDPVPEDERQQCAAPGGYSSDYWTGTYWIWAETLEPEYTEAVTTCMPWEL